MLDTLKQWLFTGDGKLLGVRSIVTMALTGSAVYLWIVGDTVTSEHIAAMSGFAGVYAGGRFAGGK